jgi:hypothetical protein
LIVWTKPNSTNSNSVSSRMKGAGTVNLLGSTQERLAPAKEKLCWREQVSLFEKRKEKRILSPGKAAGRGSLPSETAIVKVLRKTQGSPKASLSFNIFSNQSRAKLQPLPRS